MYCLDDGTSLLEGPSSMDEPATAIIGGVSLRDDANTALLGKTPETSDLPTTTSAATPAYSTTKTRKRVAVLTTVLVFLVLIAGVAFIGYRYYGSTERQINSIAVLPFQNKSGDPNSEYLSDGLAESLIYRLTQLPNLKVSPTSSVIRYKGKDTDVAKIASELGVDAVMTGRLVQIGDNLTISVELIDVRNNKLLWGEQYDRKMTDLLATQREIATMITQKLQLKLSGEEEKGISKKYTDSSEAYALYLKGRFYGAKRTANDTQKSIDNYQQATEIDPKFALAYAGLAEATHFLAIYSYPQVNELHPRAKEIALKAIELDTNLAEPHSILGIICFLDHDFSCMEREQKLAIDLNPNFSEAHRRLGLLLRALGRIDEARIETNRALEIDPLSPVTNFQHAQEFFFERRYEESEALSKKNMELDPNFWYAHLQLFYIDRTKRDYAAAVEELAKMQEARGEPGAAKLIRESFVNGDWTGFLRKITENRQQIKIYPYFVATFFAELGEKDKAFAALNEAIETKDQHTNQMKVDPYMDPLRADPRFQNVLRRAGFPE